MKYLSSKKGLLIWGTLVAICLTLSFATVYLLWDSTPDNERLKIGQMLIDINSAEEESEIFTYYFEKNMEYSLLQGLNQNINQGLLNGTDCNELYDFDMLEDCKLVNLLDIFSKNLNNSTKDFFNKNFDIKLYNMTGNTKFKTSLFEGKLIVHAYSNEIMEFGDNAERNLSYTIPIDFETSLNFDFKIYEQMIFPLKNNIDCLSLPQDINLGENALAQCLKVYPQFSNVRKEGNILLFDYTVDGALFEEEFTGPFRLNLDGLKSSF